MLEIILWAFIAGIAFAAFVAPTAIVLWWLERWTKTLDKDTTP